MKQARLDQVVQPRHLPWQTNPLQVISLSGAVARPPAKPFALYLVIQQRMDTTHQGFTVEEIHEWAKRARA